MLLELNVKDIALIKRAGVEFGPGLNILTGETGAGKSIIIGSVALALGKKARPDIVREGAEYASIELIADIPDEETKKKLSELSLLPEEGENLIISRKIGQSRSVSKINDETVTLSKLREVTELLIDIYGQHEHETLLNSGKQLEILDDFSNAGTGALRSEVQEAYAEYRALKKKCLEFTMDESERQREMDFAAFEIGEIEEAAVKEGEEEELAARYRRMNHAREIAEHLASAYGMLEESAVSAALSEIETANGYDEGLKDIRDQLFDAESILSGVTREIRDYADGMDMDEESFRETEARLDLIRSVMAKYGKTVPEIEAYRKKKEERLQELTDYEENLKRSEENCRRAEARLRELCSKLTQERKQAALIFAEGVKRELLELGFQSVSFELSFSEKEPSGNGADEVVFMAALNPGEKLRPLSEAASGGELSRVMLAAKTVLAETDRTPTLIFDEIDTGISGRTAQRVAERLALIAGRHQVICITHLPQIAAMADRHFVISKEEDGGRNVTEIRRLSDGEMLSELARLLGGAEITEAVRQNAAEMKALAEARKKEMNAGRN
ncbi:MAG: DNA repair protein RecN [Eubacteriales bacterium]|nr:DNA repair protein RecN [Eubacteriales bacterium]